MEAIQAQKTILLINQHSQDCYSCKLTLKYPLENKNISIMELLNDIQKKDSYINGSRISILNHQKKNRVFLGVYPDQSISIPQVLLDNDPIILNFTSNNKINSFQQQKKNTKKKQRTIKQAVEAVKNWEALCKREDNKKYKKMNQQEAAQLVGVPKKTLSDYRKEINLAKDNNFDFEMHEEKKIGFLKNFNREVKAQSSKLLANSLQNINTDEYWY